MSEHRFPSISGRSVVYAIETDSMVHWDQAYRTDGALGPHFLEAQTYGDGMTQHEPMRIVSCRNHAAAADYLASLAAFLMGPGMQVEDRRSIRWMWPTPPSAERVDFALSLKYREGPDRFYNLHTLKLSAAEGRQHDKRWHKVTSFNDGSVQSALNVLAPRHDDGTPYSLRWVLELWVLSETITERYRKDAGWCRSIWFDDVALGNVEQCKEAEQLGEAFATVRTVFVALAAIDDAHHRVHNYRARFAKADVPDKDEEVA